jgi:hypothetical protein
MAKRKDDTGNIAAGVTGGIALAAAAAAAGYYFYGSKDAKKHRRKAVKWAGDFKDEVVRDAKKLKSLDAESIAELVDTAAATYQGVRSIDREDLNRAAAELKANWEMVKREAQAAGKRGTRRAVATRKKAVKRGKKVVRKAKKAVKRRVRRTRR